MTYTIIKSDDYDKALNIDGKKILCYSEKCYKDLEKQAEDAGKETLIVGEVYDYKDYSDCKNDEKPEKLIAVGKKLCEVVEPGKTNTLLYSCSGYVEIGKDKYIALYQSRLPFLLTLLGIILIAILIILLLLLLGLRKPKSDAESTFHPLPPVDTNVERIMDDGNEQPSDIEEGNNSVTMTYTPSATLHISSGVIDIDFKNPTDSTHDVVIELYVVSKAGDKEEEYKIAESGRIPIGSRLNTLTFSANPGLFGGEGKYDARYHVLFYDPDTGEKAIVDSTIDEITLSVMY